MTIKSYCDNVILVELPPEPDIRREIDNLMEILRAGSGCDVVIDFNRVEIMTSLALSAFLRLRKLMEQSGQRLIFCRAAAITKDIFRVTCFDGIFEFIDSKAEALQSLQSPEECIQQAN